MIRITFIDNNTELKPVEECLTYTIFDDYIYYFVSPKEYGCRTLNQIIKVEKQVKDLTLYELKKLRYNGVGFGDNEITVQSPEDYIDITRIYKEKNTRT